MLPHDCCRLTLNPTFRAFAIGSAPFAMWNLPASRLTYRCCVALEPILPRLGLVAVFTRCARLASNRDFRWDYVRCSRALRGFGVVALRETHSRPSQTPSASKFMGMPHQRTKNRPQPAPPQGNLFMAEILCLAVGVFERIWLKRNPPSDRGFVLVQQPHGDNT